MNRRKTHIWLITTDQMRADAIGMENRDVITPVLDEMAGEGTVFERSYCASPVCTPSRASIFTGRYPHIHGAWNIGVSLNEDEMTLCDHLKKLDYATVGVGKMHFRPQCKPNGTYEAEEPAYRDRGRASDSTYYGFDQHFITEDNGIGAYTDWLSEQNPEWAERFMRDRGRSDDAAGDVWESDMPSELTQTYWTADRSIEAIASHNDDRPLFLWTSFVDPHHPFNPPRSYAERYANADIRLPSPAESEMPDRPEHLLRQDGKYWPGGGEAHTHSEDHMKRLIRNYYAMITFIDEQIGRIRDAWRAKGMYDDVLVVFTADHGELLGDHGLLYKGPWLYEGLTRVPMIVRGPGIRSGYRASALMENVDIVPTLLDALGQERPYGVQGVSQLPVITGQAAAIRDSAMTTYDAHDRGIHAKCMRTDKYKLVLFEGEAYGELFDLENDPRETANQFFNPIYREIKYGLMEAMLQRLMSWQDPLPQRKALW
ncbi:sulfatase-like hydrolase/transferase [Paenibacillus sp. LHD-117]|uniref:sulfatase family protein n=1 Tax=Paenibacillus sp. LHD-117 TaxID=3071412 RepID=UPI0027E046ED|nr:sulfatase-like hydrolase/transferase [Paenibacillus sp. LHD-117]MDQ6418854.1 sulfatase-like hydrolase/transferase [Paenibacillus sp. LHD-117]